MEPKETFGNTTSRYLRFSRPETSKAYFAGSVCLEAMELSIYLFQIIMAGFDRKCRGLVKN